jgi:hypothetical protein
MNARFHGVLAVAVVAWRLGPVGAQQRPAPDHEAHHRDMLARGTQAMGFDQERTAHHFRLYRDGGAVEVSVKDANDHHNLHAVRQHLQDIAELFKAGDFSKPALTHAQTVPGTSEMIRLKDRITYRYEQTDTGGRVRLITQDAGALAAIHTFLRFQIDDHQTGDSGTVERSPGDTPAPAGR